MKQALLSILAERGGFLPFRLAHRRKALILTYHRFSTTPTGTGAVAADVLAAQLDYLMDRYHVVPLRWLAGRLEAGARLSGPTAAITVDDGYADAHDVALPIFSRFGVPATVFAVTGFLDGHCWIWTDRVRHIVSQTRATRIDVLVGGRPVVCALEPPAGRRVAALRLNQRLKTLPDAEKEAEIARLSDTLDVELPARPPEAMRPLTWPQARALSAAGMAVESHTVTHPMLTRIDNGRLAHELSGARDRIRDELGTPADLFCYPNGGTNAAVRAAVRAAGYRAAVTTVPGFNDARTDPFSLRRIHAEQDVPHFVQSTSGFELVKARLRAAVPVRSGAADVS